MLYELSKLAATLLHPANWMLLCLLAGIFLPRKMAKVGYISALFIFIVFSNKTLYSKAFMWWSSTENQHMTLTSPFQSAVIFGGGLSCSSISGQVDFNASTDRVLEAIRLYRMGMVKRLYFSGEPLFAQLPLPQGQFEFENYLIQMGIDMCDVFIDPYARNTAENIQRFDEMLSSEDRTKPILVISSGWHLPRIMKGFESFGLNIVPYAVDMPSSTSQTKNWLDLPSWNIIKLWQQLIKEMVGYTFIQIQINSRQAT